jgi:hypothetical protein
MNPVDPHSTMSAKSGVFISKINNTEAVHRIGLSSVCSNCYFALSTMPAERRSMRQRDKRSNDPKQEDQIQMAIAAVSAGRYSSYKAASIQMNVR